MANSAFTVTGTSSASGVVVQRQSTIVSTYSSGSTIIPVDDTIPQNTEGDQYMTLSITPGNAANILVINAWATYGISSSSFMTMALFQDTTANALAASCTFNGVTVPNQIQIQFVMTAGTTSSTTFKIRMGGTSGTTYFNGNSAARVYGGVANSGMMITEYLP